MQQVVVIHGGDSFATYEEYLEFLKTVPVELEVRKGWKSGLAEALGTAYQVIMPRMPNSMNAKYAEWKLWFEKYLPHLEDGVILIGHSLGGSFLAKYLATEDVRKRVGGTLLVAPPFDEDDGRPLIEFDAPDDLAKLKAQGGRIFLYYSSDDPIVDFAEHHKFKERLPDATLRTFADRGHFLGESFSELVADIKSLG